MNLSRSLPLCVASVFLCTFASQAQQIGPAVRPSARIVSPIDETQRVTLTHTVSPLANAANDRGAAPDGMQLDRMQLVLQRSPAQETALHQLIAEMNTPGTPGYHQWLTPDQFGAQFGASDQDIATISSWLGGHGFTVSRVNPGKGTLEFSGSVAQLRNTFHTQIHKYSINGQTHFANANDPQIPAALAPAISGFASLNNFHPKSYLEKLGKASMSPATHQLSQWTWSSGSSLEYVLAPGDFAVQYDVQPLYTANVNGSGQTIAIINDSNINIDLVNQFRTLFNLPANPPQVIIDGNDPGVDGINNPDGPNGDSIEAYLDVEWSGAVAPNATVDLVVAGDTSLESGLILAMEHAVFGNVAPVISLSFGSCEAGLGSTNAFLNGLWEQAAAQGQTVMVSSGDSGSAGCDNDDTQQFALDGQAVSGFASTPYNVAVGGTDFYYTDYATGGASIANYWSTTSTQLPAVSIKGVIPEQPWNDGPYGLDIFNQFTADGSTSIAGGSGGASNAAICSTNAYSTTGVCTGTLSGYPKPAWQTGAGVPTDSVRDIPDVSLFAANGDNNSFYPICATDGDCQTAGIGGNAVQIYGVGGTSASSPAFAGIMALVNQKYGRQGQADNILYALKTQHPTDFHDVTHGSNAMPCELSPASSLDCITATPSDSPSGSGVTEGEIGNTTTKVPEYNATAGYNLATGLGTIDANNLVNDWNKIVLATSATTMTASQTSFAHGTPITVSGAVTGTGTPTGNVALMTDSTEPVNQGQAFFPLSSGAYSNATVNYLPGGTYHIWGQYGGDSKNAMSTSTPPIQITVTPETPGISLHLFNAALGDSYPGTAANPGTNWDYGSQLMVSALVAPTSQITNLQNCDIQGTSCNVLAKFTTPTGTVTFTDNGSTINTALMNAEGDAEYNAPFAIGAHSVSATYNGDPSYNKVTASSPIAFTVVKDNPAFFFGLSNLNSNGQIIAGQPTVFNLIAENNAQYTTANSTGSPAPVPVAPPTGTVTLSSVPAGFAGTATLSAGTDPSDGARDGIGVITLASLTQGNYTLTINSSGDANYQGEVESTQTGAIQVVAGSGLTASVTNASIVGSISPNSTITVTGTVTGSGSTAPTGGVLFFTSGFELGEIPLTPAGGDVSTFIITLSSQDLLPGSNFITLQYTGDTHYSPSEFNLSSGGPLANPQSDFTLVPSTTIVPVSISAGASSGADTINLASVNGFNGNVNLTCAATTPVTCSVASPAALSNQSSTTATLTISVPAGTASGNYNVLVTGKDATTGEFVHTLAITADVTGGSPAITLTNSGNVTVIQGATSNNTSVITVAPSGGFTGNVNLTCSVVTTPVTGNLTCSAGNFSTNPVDITGTASVTSTLTINTTGTTTEGTYVISVVGTSGGVTAATDVTVTVNLPQDFSLIPSGAISVNAGTNTGNTATIAVTPSNGFTGNVALTCAVTTAPIAATDPTCTIGTPADVTTASAVNETLTVTTSGSTTTGAYVITVTGTAAGPDVHTTMVNVTVNAAAPSTYTVSASNPAAISPGSSATSTISVAGSGGYTGSVTLSCSMTSGPTNQSGDAPGCSITSGSPVPLTSGTPTGQAIATVSTTAAVADLVRPNFGPGAGKTSPWSESRFAAGSGAALAVLIFFFGIPARRRSWRKLLGIVIAMAVIGVLSSCGGGSSGNGNGNTNPTNPGTTAGSYTFTITSTGNPAVTPAPTNPTFTVSVN